jgi:hypothetical protein
MECTAIEDSLFEVVEGSNFEGGPASFPVIVVRSHGIEGLDANRIIRDELAADYRSTE